jgi:catechol 2,3-dioxygenase-like lactoylglutathione lyase family enzyme
MGTISGKEQGTTMSLSDTMKGFHDVTILASNVAELRAFYTSLGFTQAVELGDDLAVFSVGASELAIHKSESRPLKALVLSFTMAEIGPLQRRLNELGITFEGPAPRRPGLVGIALSDPNENKLEFLEPRVSHAEG